MTDQAQPADYSASPIDVEVVRQWDAWLQPTIQNILHKQQVTDQLVAGAMTPETQAIPGASYGMVTNKGLTVFLMGDLGTRKTTWIAQWPKPFILSVNIEGGDDALVMYPKIACDLLAKSSESLDPPPVFNCTRPPSREVSTIEEFNKWIDLICQNHKRWGIATVGIDSLTYLIDLWITEFTKDRTKNKVYVDAVKRGKADLMRMQDWGFLNNFLRNARVKLANCGLNVIFTCLENRVYETDEANQMKRNLMDIIPLITGRSKVTLPGACKLHIHAEKRFVPGAQYGRQQVMPYYWVTPQPLVQMIRHKYYDKFPYGHLYDPVFANEPTFRAVWNELHNFIYLG